MPELLEVNHLSVSFFTGGGEVQAVRDVSFSLGAGEVLAVVGESGCGKSVLCRSIMGLLPEGIGEVVEGSITLDGEDILRVPDARLRELRGRTVSMIFQDPMSSLNPVLTVGDQILEVLQEHNKGKKKAELEKTVDGMMELVGIPANRKNEYPHEFSGGMKQRIVIAIALACEPKLILADEPTTALDVTIQAQVLDLLQELKTKLNTAIILVTHDLGVIANFADRVQVMYAGQVVERGATKEIFNEARHPYTWALLNSVPALATESKQELYALKGTPPDLILPLNHCPFAARCEYCMGICREQMPEETTLSGTHKVSCWLEHPNAPKVESFYDRRKK